MLTPACVASSHAAIRLGDEPRCVVARALLIASLEALDRPEAAPDCNAIASDGPGDIDIILLERVRLLAMRDGLRRGLNATAESGGDAIEHEVALVRWLIASQWHRRCAYSTSASAYSCDLCTLVHTLRVQMHLDRIERAERLDRVVARIDDARLDEGADSPDCVEPAMMQVAHSSVNRHDEYDLYFERSDGAAATLLATSSRDGTVLLRWRGGGGDDGSGDQVARGCIAYIPLLYDFLAAPPDEAPLQ